MGDGKTDKGVAVVGCGHWGKNLVRVFSELGALSCICDTDASRQGMMQLAKGSSPRFTDSLQNVLDDPCIGAVAIATPAATHYTVVKQCLEAGKDVFVEKPLALTSDEGTELVAIAEKCSKILMVGHILLYHPAIVKLRQLIRDGALGRILYCYSNRLNMGLIRTEENILWSFAPHDISVMLHLLDEEPIAVEATGQSYLTPGVVDVTLSQLHFKSGVEGHIFVSWLHPSKEQRLVVVGSEQMAVFDDMAVDKLQLFPHRVDWNERTPKAIKADAVTIELAKAEPLKAECSHFLDCVATRKTPLTSGREGLGVLRVLDACQQSLEKPNAAPRVMIGSHATQPCDTAQEDTARDFAAAADYFAHETACIDTPCSIGKGTKIWHFSHILSGATIGKKCSIGQNVSIASSVILGDNVKIQNNVSLYDGVVLEDDVFCGPSLVFTNVLNPRAAIVRKSEYRPTLVKKGATLGANATIICGHTIGENAFVAAGAVVTKDVPAFALVAGVPAKQIGWMCQCAAKQLELDKAGAATCTACGKKYRLTNDCLAETGV